uniref:Uncharacterized protein n=1 Tax=Anguilla anguilla TaxID=7936 RepID=A0A0E9XYD5_ANGAN
MQVPGFYNVTHSTVCLSVFLPVKPPHHPVLHAALHNKLKTLQSRMLTCAPPLN